MAKDNRFWNWIARRYSRQPVADQAAYEKKLETTAPYLRADMEVLEIGCGTGSTAIYHSAAVKSIEAVDFSDKMLEFAHQKAATAGVDNITFVNTTVEEYVARGRSFDAVFAFSILHLLADKEAVIGHIHALLPPGGMFFSSTVCANNEKAAMKTLLAIGHWLGVLPLVRFFSAEELISAMTGAGFEIEHQWQPTGGAAVFVVAVKPL